MNYTLITVGVVVLVVMTVVAIQAIMRARAMVHEQPAILEDEFSEFQRMRDEGSITEEEYQRLKRVISEQTIEKAKQGQKI
jgi:uncharacterized membrane protein